MRFLREVERADMRYKERAAEEVKKKQKGQTGELNGKSESECEMSRDEE